MSKQDLQTIAALINRNVEILAPRISKSEIIARIARTKSNVEFIDIKIPREPVTIDVAASDAKVEVAVYDKSGTKRGSVSQTTTSVGASKLVGGPVAFRRYNGTYAWVQK